MRTFIAFVFSMVALQIHAALPPVLRTAFTTNAVPTLTAMTNALGFTGSTSTFLRSDGTQAAPPGGGGGGTITGTLTSQTVPKADASLTNLVDSPILIGANTNIQVTGKVFANAVTSSNVVTGSDFTAGSTNFVAALALKSPLASPALTGVPTVPNIVLTDSSTQIANTAFVKSNITAVVQGFTNTMTSTITFNATLAPTLNISSLTTLCPRRVIMRCTLTAAITTVSAPAGTLVDGDTMVWEMIQDGTGGWTITGWDTVFGFGTDITGITLSTAAGARDFITWVYNSTATKWYCVGFTRGY